MSDIYPYDTMKIFNTILPGGGGLENLLYSSSYLTDGRMDLLDRQVNPRGSNASRGWGPCQFF